MQKYIVKRIMLLIPVIIGISFLLFCIMNLTRGDPAQIILGENATEEAVEELREEMGLNDPFFMRYFRYMGGVLQGDLGTSYRTGVPVIEELTSRFPHTLKLAVFGTALSVCIGLPIGIISAVKQYSLADNLSMMIALLLTSMPGFWLGMILILLFSLRLGWFPATGVDTLKHFVLPIFTVGAISMGTLTRMTRSTMLETIRQDYVRTARAKGAAEKRVIFKHALRNAMLPLVTVIGNNFGQQLGGTIMVEAVFAIPGVGSFLITAVRSKDAPVVIGSLMVVCLLASVVNLIIDILYAFIDPRIKSQYTKV